MSEYLIETKFCDLFQDLASEGASLANIYSVLEKFYLNCRYVVNSEDVEDYL